MPYDLPPLPPLEVTPKDLTPYRRGNTGIDYVHTFDSGRPGPHVVVNALTHGNEFCGMTAVTFLLDRAVRPVHGKLTLSFANIAAYESFDPAQPFESRFVERDFNRVWCDEILAEDDGTIELRRAREMLPLIRSADALLDIHSTSFPVSPMLCYVDQPRASAMAHAVGTAPRHIVSGGGVHHGKVMMEYGAFNRADSTATALLVECGQHFAATSGRVALQTALRFLQYCEVVDPAFIAEHAAIAAPPKADVYRISDVLLAHHDDFRFARRYQGFEELQRGEIFAYDGGEAVRAPYENCTLLMPRRRPVKGQEVVTLAQRQ